MSRSFYCQIDPSKSESSPHGTPSAHQKDTCQAASSRFCKYSFKRRLAAPAFNGAANLFRASLFRSRRQKHRTCNLHVRCCFLSLLRYRIWYVTMCYAPFDTRILLIRFYGIIMHITKIPYLGFSDRYTRSAYLQNVNSRYYNSTYKIIIFL